ncbi:MULTISPECIES: hypothetical protein [unclassified Vibrio]|uniref:hypothetical protein n=1 Tax=unclassified Vibrio TaxID=2614977 RepID=UPI0018808FC5|nr:MULTISPECIES: hypothetical protein [unclassified Vibrio]EGX6965359.1 hypothetical protein [Vibrio alginolyticus]EJX2557642.1 hypothetical protein [Vibrio alginolyticus]ELB2822345.1 hypothetical protein [Vibrio alginolyticus]MBE8569547.1 hypothetical protein [Vibrio sp. OPT46]MBE8579665.1 hypothetical protein [Vibrio sp. OPT41]
MSNFDFKPKDKSEYISIFSLWDKKLGVIANLKFLIIEMFFGIQIVELLTDTNSIELSKSGPISLGKAGESDNGMVGGLSKFIPATLMTKVIEKSIAEMLFYKYLGTYKFIIIADKDCIPSGSWRVAEVTEVLYRLNKHEAHQLVPYKGKMTLIWTSLETLVASVSWISTNSLEITLLLTGVMEFLRRFRI